MKIKDLEYLLGRLKAAGDWSDNLQLVLEVPNAPDVGLARANSVRIDTGTIIISSEP